MGMPKGSHHRSKVAYLRTLSSRGGRGGGSDQFHTKKSTPLVSVESWGGSGTMSADKLFFFRDGFPKGAHTYKGLNLGLL